MSSLRKWLELNETTTHSRANYRRSCREASVGPVACWQHPFQALKELTALPTTDAPTHIVKSESLKNGISNKPWLSDLNLCLRNCEQHRQILNVERSASGEDHYKCLRYPNQPGHPK